MNTFKRSERENEMVDDMIEKAIVYSTESKGIKQPIGIKNWDRLEKPIKRAAAMQTLTLPEEEI